MTLDPQKGLQIIGMQHNLVISEEDNLGLHFSNAVEKEFVAYKIEHTNLPTRDGSLVEFILNLDPDLVIHHRSIYTILDLLGDIGGL